MTIRWWVLNWVSMGKKLHIESKGVDNSDMRL